MLFFLIGFLVVVKSQQANVECLLEHCGILMTECELNHNCRKGLTCVNDCLKYVYPNDTSYGYLTTQNCTEYCIATYGDETFYKFNACASDYNCVTLPPINITCKNNNITLINNFDINMMTNRLYMIYGYNYVYDCLPCQSLIYSPLNSTTYQYKNNYTLITLDGAYKPEYLTFPIDYDSSTHNPYITFNYQDQGESHHETWFIMGQNVNQGWMIIYYCGSANTWGYEGALVLSQTKTVSQSSLNEIISIINANGFNFAEWCTIDNNVPGIC